MEWTQDESVAFEAARELLTMLIAIRSSQIDDAKNSGSVARAGSLEGERSQLVKKRESLSVTDVEGVKSIFDTYSQEIKLWNSKVA